MQRMAEVERGDDRSLRSIDDEDEEAEDDRAQCAVFLRPKVVEGDSDRDSDSDSNSDSEEAEAEDDHQNLRGAHSLSSADDGNKVDEVNVLFGEFLASMQPEIKNDSDSDSDSEESETEEDAHGVPVDGDQEQRRQQASAIEPSRRKTSTGGGSAFAAAAYADAATETPSEEGGAGDAENSISVGGLLSPQELPPASALHQPATTSTRTEQSPSIAMQLASDDEASILIPLCFDDALSDAFDGADHHDGTAVADDSRDDHALDDDDDDDETKRVT
mmetsp:Transcript_27358/g.84002  ORF Transcript_27358/g.84002 Transcript_27358/m.84002 type:complete len:275 (-) Transcript_27358:945-1769(-)